MCIRDRYQEIILEHGKNPRNLGKTDNFNKDAKGNNPLCGDNVHVYLKLNDQRKVEDISFEGSGCAISMASASIMTDLIKGRSDNEAKEIIEDFLGMIKENPELKSNILKEDDKTKLMCLSGVKQYPMRVKCATLSWHTLVSAMENDGKEISTEKWYFMEIKDKIIEEIKKIYDPELPVNIYDLGLIYDVQVNQKKAKIKMTLTTPNCPVAESLPKEVKEGAMQVEEIEDVDLELVWDPPWTKDMMSDAAKLELNL